jgi:hypothetical protein
MKMVYTALLAAISSSYSPPTYPDVTSSISIITNSSADCVLTMVGVGPYNGTDPTIGVSTQAQSASAAGAVSTSAITTTGGMGKVGYIFTAAPDSMLGGSADPVVTDSKGNTWVEQSYNYRPSNPGYRFSIWKCANFAGGSSHIFTLTATASSNRTITFVEINGVEVTTLPATVDTSSPFTGSVTVPGNAVHLTLCWSTSDVATPSGWIVVQQQLTVGTWYVNCWYKMTAMSTPI